MCKIDELIQSLCPNGVAFKSVGNTVGINRGKRLTKTQLADEYEYEVYHGSKDSILGKYNHFNAPANTTIVVNTGGIGGVKYIDKPFWCSDGSFWLGQSESIKPKYLYYCLSGYEDYFASQKREGGVPTIDRSVVEDFRIPIPPLAVQEEIVRILDKFTELEAELEKELEARKKQYEWYRDQLLTFGENIPVATLNEIFNTRNGYTPSKTKAEFWEQGTIPWFRLEDIRENGTILTDALQHVTSAAIKGSLFPVNSIIVATSATIGVHALITEESIANQRFTCLMLKEKYKNLFDMKFLYYYCFKLDEYCKEHLNQGNFASVDMAAFSKFQFPIPSIEEQQRIVAVLDRLDALCNDITTGLPAEIAARRKQYEYYRDKLLSFEEVA